MYLIIFYTIIGPDLANNIITPTKTSVYDYLTSRNKESMFLSPIDECEVISVLNGCKSKTSTDCDDIDFRLIKSVITSIVKPITYRYIYIYLIYLFKLEFFLKK